MTNDIALCIKTITKEAWSGLSFFRKYIKAILNGATTNDHLNKGTSKQVFHTEELEKVV